VALPSVKDPDVYVRTEGAEAYRQRLKEALPYIEYLAREVAGRVDLGRAQGKVQALNEVLPFLARLDNPVLRSSQVEMLATVFGIEDRLVLQELKDAVRERKKAVGEAPRPGAPGARRAESEAESSLVRALLDDAEVRSALLPQIEEDDLPPGRVLEIVRVVRGLTEEGAEDALTRIAALPHPGVTVESGRGCLDTLRAALFTRQMTDIQKQLEHSGNAVEINELLHRKLTLKRRIEALRGVSAS
jgi:DNA primase